MTELDLWAMFGIRRIPALARRLGISVYLVKELTMTDDIRQAMSEVELSEMLDEVKIKNNILKAAKLTSHGSELVRKRAYFALVAWSEIYGGFENV